jgi:hypothetical protein
LKRRPETAVAARGADEEEVVAVAVAGVQGGLQIQWYGNRCADQKHQSWAQNRKQAGNQASIDTLYHFSAADAGRTISGTIIIG